MKKMPKLALAVVLMSSCAFVMADDVKTDNTPNTGAGAGNQASQRDSINAAGTPTNSNTANANGAMSNQPNANDATTQPNDMDAMMANMTDEQFANHAAEAGMAEVKFSQLAQQKAQNANVKAFADRMVTDHTKANDQLMDIAKKDNMNLPTDINDKQKATWDKLNGLSNDDFDKAYMHTMVRDHVMCVALFTHEADQGQKDDLKQFAKDTLPTLQDHLASAKNVAQRIDAPTDAASEDQAQPAGGRMGNQGQ